MGHITPWELRDSETVIDTPWFSMNKNEYYIPHIDQEKTYYILNERSGANIVAKTKEGKVILVSQYRAGADEIFTEFPAGFIEDGDTHQLERAQQELLEESGYGGGTWHAVGFVDTMPNRAHKRDYCFLALDVELVSEQSLDENEEITISLADPEEVEAMIARNEISCTTCVASWHKAMAFEKTLKQ